MFYHQGRANLLTLMNWIQLFINLLFNFYLIAEFGGLGAAMSTLITRLFGAVFVLLLVNKKDE